MAALLTPLFIHLYTKYDIHSLHSLFKQRIVSLIGDDRNSFTRLLLVMSQSPSSRGRLASNSLLDRLPSCTEGGLMERSPPVIHMNHITPDEAYEATGAALQAGLTGAFNATPITRESDESLTPIPITEPNLTFGMHTPSIPADLMQLLPKADLHCHLDGSVRPSTILELYQEQGYPLPWSNIAELTAMISARNATCLEEYLQGFFITLKVLQKAYAITRVVYEVAEDAVKDGCRYIEIRFSPILHIEEGLSLTAVIDAVIEGLVMAQHQLPIVVRIIVCGMRQLKPEVSRTLAQLAWRYRESGVVAFDLAGPEAGFNSKRHKAAFTIAMQECLNVTIHAGEGYGAESIFDSVRHCGAHRIGHGVALKDSLSLTNFMRDRRIPIEVCLTSNLQTKAAGIKSLSEHPFPILFAKNLVLALCTDNRSVSEVTLTSEYMLAQESWGLSPAQVVRLLDYSFKSSFLQVAIKQRLRVEVLRDALRLLDSRGYNITSIIDELRGTVDSPFEDSTFSISLERCYWKGKSDSIISIETIRKLPKTDLDIRLAGSVPLEIMWNEISQSAQTQSKITKETGLVFNCYDDFFNFIITQQHENIIFDVQEKKKILFELCLQTEDQLRRGCKAIVTSLRDDGVMYAEMVVNPSHHCYMGLSMKQVVEVILSEISLINNNNEYPYPLTLNVILGTSSYSDDPVIAMDVAKLVVEFRDKGVCGYGLFGSTGLPVDGYRYYTSVFSYLKSHHINVVIAAGKQDADTIKVAMSDGGAARLSGCFSAHSSTSVMGMLASRDMCVEIAPTYEMSMNSSDLNQDDLSLIRLLFDMGIRVTICSFHRSMEHQTLSEIYSNLILKYQIQPYELVKLLGHGFRFSFLSLDIKTKLYQTFLREIEGVLRPEGHEFLRKIHWFNNKQN